MIAAFVVEVVDGPYNLLKCLIGVDFKSAVRRGVELPRVFDHRVRQHFGLVSIQTCADTTRAYIQCENLGFIIVCDLKSLNDATLRTKVHLQT